VEVIDGISRLSRRLASLAKEGELREFAMTHYLLLYAHVDATVCLLSIRHHRQMSFDFPYHWPA